MSTNRKLKHGSFSQIGCIALILCVACPVWIATGTDDPGETEEPEVQELRERLTEREDENRVEDPWVINIFDRPLAILGQYEISLEFFNQLSFGFPTNYGSGLIEQEVELELFYPISSWVTLFAQALLATEKELDSDNPEQLSETFIERGEMWIFIARELEDAPFSIEIGRLEFEDDRLWWWDEDLDAVRLALDADTIGLELSAAEEQLPKRSDQSQVEPEHEDVLRLMAEASWDWGENHELGLFGLKQNDRSRSEPPGTIIALDREDDSDANLDWIGIRAQGAAEMGAFGAFAYWIDVARVNGKEKVIETDDGKDGDDDVEGGENDEDAVQVVIPRNHVLISDVMHRNVHGWAFDTGVTWLMPMAGDPRLTVAYAWGSGDRSPGTGSDSAFRQTGLQGNEPGFGGVERFSGYGELLDPELSNLAIFTLGLGVSLLENSSLDITYHNYQLVELADSLRDARVDTDLTGLDRDVGEGFDLIFALKEWETIELLVSTSLFRTGDAFGVSRDEWIYGNSFAFRIAF